MTHINILARMSAIKKFMILTAGLLIVSLFFLSSSTNAAPPAKKNTLLKKSVLPLEMALEAASTALETCEEDGYNVTVAVVDRSGVEKVVLKGDDVGPHTIASSIGKAFTSASMGRPTGDIAAAIANNPELDELKSMDERILILAGGLPIRIDDELVAGIGVGGAPGGHLDEACAQAGIDEITGS